MTKPDTPSYAEGSHKGGNDDQRPDDSFQLTAPLRLIAKNTWALMRLKLSDIGMEAGQPQFILALPNDGSVRIGTVADMLNVRASTISKMANRLVKDGLVLRVPDCSDLRKTNLILTPNGIAQKARIETLLAGIEKELTAGLGDKIVEITSMLERLDDTLSNKLRRLR